MNAPYTALCQFLDKMHDDDVGADGVHEALQALLTTDEKQAIEKQRNTLERLNQGHKKQAQPLLITFFSFLQEHCPKARENEESLWATLPKKTFFSLAETPVNQMKKTIQKNGVLFHLWYRLIDCRDNDKQPCTTTPYPPANIDAPNMLLNYVTTTDLPPPKQARLGGEIEQNFLDNREKRVNVFGEKHITTELIDAFFKGEYLSEATLERKRALYATWVANDRPKTNIEDLDSPNYLLIFLTTAACTYPLYFAISYFFPTELTGLEALLGSVLCSFAALCLPFMAWKRDMKRAEEKEMTFQEWYYDMNIMENAVKTDKPCQHYANQLLSEDFPDIPTKQPQKPTPKLCGLIQTLQVSYFSTQAQAVPTLDFLSVLHAILLNKNSYINADKLGALCRFYACAKTRYGIQAFENETKAWPKLHTSLQQWITEYQEEKRVVLPETNTTDQVQIIPSLPKTGDENCAGQALSLIRQMFAQRKAIQQKLDAAFFLRLLSTQSFKNHPDLLQKSRWKITKQGEIKLSDPNEVKPGNEHTGQLETMITSFIKQFKNTTMALCSLSLQACRNHSMHTVFLGIYKKNLYVVDRAVAACCHGPLDLGGITLKSLTVARIASLVCFCCNIKNDVKKIGSKLKGTLNRNWESDVSIAKVFVSSDHIVTQPSLFNIDNSLSLLPDHHLKELQLAVQASGRGEV